MLGAGEFVSDTTDPFLGTPFVHIFGPRSCGASGTEPFATRPDGSFTLTSNPLDTQGVVVDGRFLSPTTAAATFRFDIRQPPVRPGCLDGTFSFTAALTQDEPPPPGLLPEGPRTINYVALGDSYSAGEGVQPFLAGTDTPSDRCHRSKYAYSRAVQLSPLPLSRSFFACSGATTSNLLTTVQYPGEQVVQLGHMTELSKPTW